MRRQQTNILTLLNRWRSAKCEKPRNRRTLDVPNSSTFFLPVSCDENFLFSGENKSQRIRWFCFNFIALVTHTRLDKSRSERNIYFRGQIDELRIDFIEPKSKWKKISIYRSHIRTHARRLTIFVFSLPFSLNFNFEFIFRFWSIFNVILFSV